MRTLSGHRPNELTRPIAVSLSHPELLLLGEVDDPEGARQHHRAGLAGSCSEQPRNSDGSRCERPRPRRGHGLYFRGPREDDPRGDGELIRI